MTKVGFFKLYTSSTEALVSDMLFPDMNVELLSMDIVPSLMITLSPCTVVAPLSAASVCCSTRPSASPNQPDKIQQEKMHYLQEV